MNERSISIKVFPVRQPIGTYFVGVASAGDLLKICRFDYRRMEFGSGYADFLGIQRPVNEKRQREIANYARTADAVFPTAIVLSVPEKCASVRSVAGGMGEIVISSYEDPEFPELNIPLDQVASIIDGQHRLKGVEEAELGDIEMPVAIFVGADDATEANIFSVVNLAQTKVNKSLVYDLFALSRHRSPEKTCHEVVVALDRMSGSPFQGRIMRLGVATEGRKGEFLSQATVVRGLLPYITSDALADRDRGRRFGFWEPIEGPPLKRRIFYPFFQAAEDEKILANVLNYFNAVRARWPDAWPKEDEEAADTGKMIFRTNGYNAFVRFLRDCYNAKSVEPRVVEQDEYLSILNAVKLEDDDFNVRKFVPGSSGSSSLYRQLIADSEDVRLAAGG